MRKTKITNSNEEHNENNLVNNLPGFDEVEFREENDGWNYYELTGRMVKYDEPNPSYIPEIRDFLGLFFEPEETIYFRSIPPKVPEGRKRDHKERTSIRPVKFASLQKKYPCLVHVNQRYGIYFNVNSGGSKEGGINKFNAVYIDIDDGRTLEELALQLDNLGMRPSIIIKTKQGWHIYWLIAEEDRRTITLEDWRDWQARLIEAFKSDKACKDASRVLRVPFFDHIDAYGERQMIEIVESNVLLKYKAHQIKELTSGIQLTTEVSKKLTTASVNAEPEATIIAESAKSVKTEPETSVTAPSADAIVSIPDSGGFIPTAIPVGSRNTELTRLGGKLRRKGFSETEIYTLLKMVHDLRCPVPFEDPEAEIQSISRSISRYEPVVDAAQRKSSLKDVVFAGIGNNEEEEEEPESIITGLWRGAIGMVQAVPNVGKSTLLRNIAIALATGREFLDIVAEGKPKSVLLVDYETQEAWYRKDLRTMTQEMSEDEIELLQKNFKSFVVQSRKHARSLNLSNADDRHELMEFIREEGFDLVIIDTVTQAFTIKNENDNAHIKDEIIKPLMRIANSLNCGILFAHHNGKAGLEGGENHRSVLRSRGASSFADGPLILELDNKTDKFRLKTYLKFAKIKDAEFNHKVYEVMIDESRWFQHLEGNIANNPIDDVIAFVRGNGGQAKYAEIVGSLKISSGKGDRSVKRWIESACDQKLLKKSETERGMYYLPVVEGKLFFE